jgi:hypothetical protein
MIEEMSQPGNKLNVPCDWCEDTVPSVCTASNPNGIRYYACNEHRDILHETVSAFKRAGQHLSRLGIK